jgi:hypothetical protein
LKDEHEIGSARPEGERDVTTDAGITRLPHLAHAALADGRDDFIRAEFVAWLERHLGVRAKFIRSESGYILDDGASVPYFFKFGVFGRSRRSANESKIRQLRIASRVHDVNGA